MLDISALVIPSAHHRLARSLEDIPGYATNTQLIATFAASALLCWMAANFARRQFRAWFVSMILVSMSLGIRLWAIKSAHMAAVVPIAVNIAIIAFLLLAYREFPRAGNRHPRRHSAATRAAQHNWVRRLLDDSPAGDSLDYFALRHDKAIIWEPGRRAGIAYAVAHGVMLASGDPLGDPDHWGAAIETFTAEAHRHAWVIGVAGCSERGMCAWKAHADVESLEIGDEAIVELADFSLAGNSKKNLRRQQHRAERSGAIMRIASIGDLEPRLRARLAHGAEQWRNGRTERGFSMALGRTCDPVDANALIAWAEVDGQPTCVLQFVPWGPHGLSLDLMRRGPQAPAGIMDALILRVIAFAREQGYREISLNFAPFRSALVPASGPASLARRTWRRLLLLASTRVQIESMLQFNAKYRPRWMPRYLLYPSARDFARVSTAYLRAERFITTPHWLPGARPRTLMASAR